MSQRLGIVGGGQLGRMLIFEAKKLGFEVIVLDPTPGSPAAQVADRQIIADFNDEAAIRELAASVDFLTFEIELANAAILDELTTGGVRVNPSARSLEIIKDKLRQKTFLRESMIPVADFMSIDTRADLEQAALKYGYPFLVKARFDGYDGRGNFLVENKIDQKKAWDKLVGRLIYAEKFVPFVKELAVVVGRNELGEIRSYPVVETVHRNNICHLVYAPAPVSLAVRKKAGILAEKVMRKLEGAGVFAIEMFLTAAGKVLVNEIAPRVHNSGHYTIEACHTSQFEQHIRAVTGLPLGDSGLKTRAAVMVNILGTSQHPAQLDGLVKALAIPQLSVHIYGKAETKAERKMGHITALGKTLAEAQERALQARQFIDI